ncbi:MAG: TRAP transporter small permease protein [Oscillospiraceae bacterium]|jgi:TRAP-type C4-dicarboxylate transport system permease small subunit
MKKVTKWLNEKLEVTLCICLMSIMTLAIFLQVIMRYVFNNSLSWSEELARYTFIWLIYLGISYGCQLMKHIKIDASLKLFPKKARKYIVIVGDICFLAFSIYVVITGGIYAAKTAASGDYSAAMHIPMVYINSAPCVGFALASIRQIQTIIYRVNRIRHGEEEDL